MLGFSYMTFAIKQKIEEKSHYTHIMSYIFDNEAYNYLFNKSTAFLDGEFVWKDHQVLDYVLEKMYDFDKNFVE